MKILIVAVVIAIQAIANKPEKKYLCGHLKANFTIYTTVSVPGCLIFRFDGYSVSVRPALVSVLPNSIDPPSST